MTGPVRRWGPWLLLVLVLGVALAVGTSRGSAHQTLEQRTLSVAGQVRCPVCEGESAAESNTAAAEGIRQVIRTDLTHGQSSQQIVRSLESDYGTTILESPPTSGITLWAWLVPVVVAAAAVVGLGLGFRHWRRRPAVAATPGVAPADEALVREALAGGGPPAERGVAGGGVAGGGVVAGDVAAGRGPTP
jgi:cytochrome c-type biogenesis protein CcmH